MSHPYPPRLVGFSYVGRYSYSLEFTTDERRQIFVEESVVRLVLQQIPRAAAKYPFLGSQRYTVDELLQICEYTDATLLD